MINAFEVATAGGRIQQARIELLADRVAKVRVAGFKGDFASVQATRQKAGELAAPDKMRLTVDFSEGALRETNSRMDVAIRGKGLLVATDGKRRIYTRGGNLHVDKKMHLAIRNGLKLLNANGDPIQVTGDYPIDISDDGKVRQGGELRGKLALVDFSGDEELLRRRGSDFVCTDKRYNPHKAGGQVKQGMLEQSNVDGIRAMVELIEASRLFEASMRAVNYSDRSLTRLINDVGSIPA